LPEKVKVRADSQRKNKAFWLGEDPAGGCNLAHSGELGKENTFLKMFKKRWK
jgi:hypothetical protein